MARYRIVIEVDTKNSRAWVNSLAKCCYDVTVTRKSNPVYLATEEVKEENRNILAEKD